MDFELRLREYWSWIAREKKKRRRDKKGENKIVKKAGKPGTKVLDIPPKSEDELEKERKKEEAEKKRREAEERKKKEEEEEKRLKEEAERQEKLKIAQAIIKE